MGGGVMASRWADRLPRVSVPYGSPKPVTFIYPYYESPKFLLTQVAGWFRYPADLCALLRAIVVDDGSPTPAVLPTVKPFPMRLFRIAVDVRWNWLAARNIGAHYAEDGWIFLSDMDHVVPPKTAHAMVYGRHNPKMVYVFSRKEHTGQIVPPHSASFLMTRELFWRIGGYDEMLSGFYGTDGDFRRRVQAVAPIQVLTDVLERHEFVSDASSTRYQRKQPEDATVRKLMEARTLDWAPKVLSFPYQEVTC